MSGPFPGKATHYRPDGKTACGRNGVSFFTTDRRKVDCRQCLRALKKSAKDAA